MRGFTLIELLVYAAVLSLVLVLALQFTLGVVVSTAKSAAKEEVQTNAAAILRVFDFEIRHAQSIYTPTSDFINDPGQLSFLSARDIPADESEGYTDMYLDRGKFCVKRELTGVSCATPSGVEITSLQFTRIAQAGGEESARIRFTIRNISQKREYQFAQTVQTSARLRSY
ncbi:MAG: prepilin-type N-terminal cleavage/methylation domain-containing protein [Candidatus Spechtbacterales bacterium]